jgi:hypothetical protein
MQNRNMLRSPPIASLVEPVFLVRGLSVELEQIPAPIEMQPADEMQTRCGQNHKPTPHHSLVVCDESGHTKFPFSFVVLSWGELWLICPELPLMLP